MNVKIQDEMIFYLNIVMDSEGTMYTRQHYTLIDLLEQQGGITQCFFILAIILVYPFSFRRHELQVILNHEKDESGDYTFEHDLRDSFLAKLHRRRLPVEFYAFIHSVKRMM